MSRILILKIFLWMALSNIKAQDNVYPAKPQSQTIVIKNGTKQQYTKMGAHSSSHAMHYSTAKQ